MWHALGSALLDIENETEGRDALDRALELRPGLAAAHTALGAYLARTGRPREACEAYRRALAVDPDDGAARAGAATTCGLAP